MGRAPALQTEVRELPSHTLRICHSTSAIIYKGGIVSKFRKGEKAFWFQVNCLTIESKTRLETLKSSNKQVVRCFRCSQSDEIVDIWKDYWYTVKHIYDMSINTSNTKSTYFSNIDTETCKLPWTSCISNLHTKLGIICKNVPGFATDSPCGVWCPRWATCLLYGGPIFGFMILNDNWCVRLV